MVALLVMLRLITAEAMEAAPLVAMDDVVRVRETQEAGTTAAVLAAEMQVDQMVQGVLSRNLARTAGQQSLQPQTLLQCFLTGSRPNELSA